MAGAPAALLAALEGRPIERPLRAPLLAALAAEVEELDLREFLADAGKRSRILAGLAASMGFDVLVVDSGSGWDAESCGLVTDWGAGYPPGLHAAPGVTLRFDPGRGGAPVILDLLRRVRAVVPDAVSLGVTLVGPAVLVAASASASASADALTLPAAAQVVLAAARAVAEAGAGVVIVREDGRDAVDVASYLAASTPLWRSLQFFRSVGALHVSGGADGWADVLGSAGPFLPVFNAAESPGAAAAVAAAGRPYGLALMPGSAGPPPGPLAPDRCALLTHDRDLAGQVPVRDAAGVVAGMTI
jgi:hypothetical protein